MIDLLQIPERPRERCLIKGPEVLSLRECLALVIGNGPRTEGSLGLAARILDRPGTGLSEPEQARAFFTAMEAAPSIHLDSLRGLGPATRARILAAFELGRRYSAYREGALRRAPLQDYGELALTALARVDAEHRANPREWLGFVPVHRSGQVGDLCVVERGVRTHVNTDPAELFARILALRPRAFLLFHNHPNGTLGASPADKDLTERVEQLGQALGIHLLAHFIVTATGEKLISTGRRSH